jgi:signal transduction histidine kinase
MRPPAVGKTFWRWTVSHQILMLVAVCVLCAQAAGLVVLLTLPPRPPAPVAMEQALERIRETVKLVGPAKGSDVAHEIRAASDRRLVFSLLDQAPTAAMDPFSMRMEALIAQRLGLPPEHVLVVDIGPPRSRNPPQPDGPGGGDAGGPAPNEADGPGPLPGPGPGAAQGFGPNPGFAGPPPDGPFQSPRDVNQALDRAIAQQRPPGARFFDRRDPRFRAGLRNRDVFPRGRRALAVKAGPHWLLVRSPPSLADALWLRQVALTFALTLAALLLPALWMAHRTARRIKAFSEGADRFGRNPDSPEMPEEGPYELRQAAQAFNRMQARIKRLVSDRTMMMAAVSHDLRTPLARMRFRIAELDPVVRDSIAEDIQQMDELITQMLSFTRDASSSGDRRRFDLSALVQSLVDDMADEGKDITFEGLDKLTVEANLASVRRILSNLLDNALQYAGAATVRLAVDGDMALAMVEDTGPGVPADMHEAIFEPFRRLEPSRNRNTGGVGLGLAIARNLARGHGGDIVVDRAWTKGARFVFSLPMA